jgi:uncharacterized protein (TIGR03118 family)
LIDARQSLDRRLAGPVATIQSTWKEVTMKKLELWAVAAASAMIGVGCGDQPSTGGGATAAGSQLLAEVSVAQRAPIEGRVAETNIVSDDRSKVRAKVADPHLLNAWGLAFFPDGPAWISANGQGTLEVYDAAGTRAREVVVPSTSVTKDPATPTGQVFNGDPTAFEGDRFIAATEDGAVVGWQPATSSGMAEVRVNKPPAVYKGLAIGTADGQPYLYVADFHDGAIAVFNSSYGAASLPGSFTDPDLPAHYAPFNVVAVGPLLLVSYAQQDSDAHDDIAGAGFGFVDLFTTEGFFVQRLISGGALNSPWAMVLAPDRDRGSVDLLVGNFGDGMINVYDLSVSQGRIAADFEGPLGDRAGKPLVIPGLWALAFGSGGAGFDPGTLYFTAGPNGEADGLFGSLRFVGPRR